VLEEPDTLKLLGVTRTAFLGFEKITKRGRLEEAFIC